MSKILSYICPTQINAAVLILSQNCLLRKKAQIVPLDDVCCRRTNSFKGFLFGFGSLNGSMPMPQLILQAQKVTRCFLSAAVNNLVNVLKIRSASGDKVKHAHRYRLPVRKLAKNDISGLQMKKAVAQNGITTLIPCKIFILKSSTNNLIWKQLF